MRGAWHKNVERGMVNQQEKDTCDERGTRWLSEMGRSNEKWALTWMDMEMDCATKTTVHTNLISPECPLD